MNGKLVFKSFVSIFAISLSVTVIGIISNNVAPQSKQSFGLLSTYSRTVTDIDNVKNKLILSNGYQVSVELLGYSKANNIGSISGGGYISVLEEIHSITEIDIDVTGSISLYSGIYDYETHSVVFPTLVDSTSLMCYEFIDDYPDYFKIVANEDVVINSITITYLSSCVTDTHSFRFEVESHWIGTYTYYYVYLVSGFSASPILFSYDLERNKFYYEFANIPRGIYHLELYACETEIYHSTYLSEEDKLETRKVIIDSDELISKSGTWNINDSNIEDPGDKDDDL